MLMALNVERIVSLKINPAVVNTPASYITVRVLPAYMLRGSARTINSTSEQLEKKSDPSSVGGSS